MERPRQRINWSLILSLASFLGGYIINAGSNYLAYTQKVDQLSTNVAQLAAQVEKLGGQLESRDEKHNRLSSRVTVLEVKVFGQSATTSNNYITMAR